MSEELHQQAVIISDLQEIMDTTQIQIRSLKRRVREALQSSHSDWQLQAIMLLSMLLVVLILTLCL